MNLSSEAGTSDFGAVCLHQMHGFIDRHAPALELIFQGGITFIAGRPKHYMRYSGLAFSPQIVYHTLVASGNMDSGFQVLESFISSVMRK